MDTCRAAKHHQIQQGITTQTIRPMNRNAGHFTHGKQSLNHLVITLLVLGDCLSVYIGRNSPHHVMTGRDDWNRFLDRVHMRKGTGQFKDSRKFGVQCFFTQMVQFQQYMIPFRTNTPPAENFQHHGSGYHIPTRQVLGIGSIAFHETFTIFIDQVTTLTAASFSNEYSGPMDTGRMKLPHFNILNREASSQRHTNTVTGIDQGIGGRGINTTGTTSGKYRRLGFDVNRFAGLHADGDDTNNSTVLVFDDIRSKPFIEETGIVFQVALIEGMQKRMSGSVSSGAGTCSLSALAVILGLPTKGTLVDTAIFITGKRQPHMLQFEHCLRTFTAHVFDSILVTDIVRPLDGVIHMPAPVIIRISTGYGAGNSALSRNCMRTCRKYFGNYCRVIS